MTNKTIKAKLIIVEDEILVAQDIANRLSNANYQILGIADSTQSALELIEQHQEVELLLLDIVLKGHQDGIELADIINQTFKVPFIFLTGQTDSSFIERAKKVKPSAYLLKPFNERQVSIAIDLALQNFSNR